MRKLIYCLAAFYIIFSSCKPQHLIPDDQYLEKVNQSFEARKLLASNRNADLFSVFDNNLSIEREEALKFLYAFMPLNDLADYSGNFLLANTDLALKTRNETSWGKNVPVDIFLHYILPPRVNNENLDSFRIAYFDELAARIKGMDLSASALEINHWCHEKVSYQGADIRTSAPMSTILSARGRCGEESTFTVAALRTAGIPARQVYTPRWAHSDDNHAWVEVWIDGNWFYMGACEPEAVLDRGWFTEPARRAMLIHTKSFGAPTGDENTIVEFSNYSIVNNLSKYAVTKNLFVKVLDEKNNPAENAEVEFQLYNYAEFYPLAIVPTDLNGLSHFETGLGDLLIWAHKGDSFGFEKVSVNDYDTIVIKLDRTPANLKDMEFDLGVPVVRAPFEGPSAEIIKNNGIRVNDENKIRQKYIESWMKSSEAADLAKKIGADTSVVKDILNRSMGNYKAISSLLLNCNKENLSVALDILSVIADKDLRDTPERILSDHLNNIVKFENVKLNYDFEIYKRYVLNPRIDNEIIAPWRKYLLNSLPENQRNEMAGNPALIVNYVNDRITINDSDNYYKTPLTPVGVNELKVSDRQSRNIYFVALCRTLGIPSRLEDGSRTPQYYDVKGWRDVYFNGEKRPAGSKGYIKLLSSDTRPVPEYYIHFTLARFENGRYNTLEYDYNKRITDFKEELQLVPGNYMIVTGNRISDSKILSTVSFFELKENEHKTINITLRKDISPAEILGKFDLTSDIILTDGKSKQVKELSEKGLVITWVEPDKEPTKHIFNDLPLLKKELDQWGGYFIFLTDQSIAGKTFNPGSYSGLPVNTVFGYDTGSELLKKLCGGVSCSTVRLPLMIVVDKAGNILLRSEGYRIGIGEQILKKVK